MSGSVRIRGSALAAAVALAAAAAPGRAEPAPVEIAQASPEIYGTWYRTGRPGGVRLSDGGVTSFLGRSEWVEDAETCTQFLTHDLESVDAAALHARLTSDDFYDENGVAIADAMQGRLPDGTVTALTHSCCCPVEIVGQTTYVLVAPSRLLAVAFGDGAYAVEDLQRDPPLVPPQTLDQETREAIQRALAALGLYTDEIDGAFGPVSRTAIADFQESLGDERIGILNRHQLDILLND